MPKVCHLEDVIDDTGRQVASIDIFEEDFSPKKAVILADPDKHGYTKDILDKLEKAGMISKPESDSAKVKATK